MRHDVLRWTRAPDGVRHVLGRFSGRSSSGSSCRQPFKRRLEKADDRLLPMIRLGRCDCLRLGAASHPAPMRRRACPILVRKGANFTTAWRLSTNLVIELG